MESNKKYVIGLDFGTDSCRALVVDTYTGREMATGVSFYPRWKAGLYCDAHNNRYRQHPLDYIESMIEAVHIALSDLKEEEIASICGLCFDTTGSTPALTDKAISFMSRVCRRTGCYVYSLERSYSCSRS